MGHSSHIIDSIGQNGFQQGNTLAIAITHKIKMETFKQLESKINDSYIE